MQLRVVWEPAMLNGRHPMKRELRAFAAALSLAIGAVNGAFAQKSGGILHVPFFDSPPSLSMLEESTFAANRPMMGVFNNLVMYDQHVAQNSLKSIVPDLATGWSWNEEGTELMMPLRHGVKWHDGKPFTAADVVCTWDLLTDKRPDKLRLNPRKAWYANLTEVTTRGDYEVTFHLKRPQPAFLAMLASGWSPVYPCHVTAREMRQHPIGTGPFKLLEFRPNEVIRVGKNPDYWKPGRPYLDGIEYSIIKDLSTRTLAFIGGKGDLINGVTIPQVNDVKAGAPQAICEVVTSNTPRNLLVNRDKPPFDNPLIRRAMSLTLDRKAFIDILYQGMGYIGGAMLPPPDGLWGLPPDRLQALPGYGPDIAKNRADARNLMEKAGYGPANKLKIQVSTRNTSYYRDPAVILIDQLKQIYIDADLDPLDTTQWYPKLIRKDYNIGLNITEAEVDDPDAMFYENYVCGAPRNYTGYCNREIDRRVEEQSRQTDPDRRKQMVWEIEKQLVEDDARPIVFYGRIATCWQPQVKGLVNMVNSIYNGARFEDLWLDR
jgi:peptide/nickel transport system substrate-binding protein